MSWLTMSPQGPTFGLVAVSTVVGALLGAFARFLFEDVLRSWMGVRQQTRRVIRQYAAPLVRSAESLERRINILVRNESRNWFANDEYTRLSTLYVLGEHLCWIRIIEREFGFLPFESSRAGKMLNKRLNGIFRALTSHAYFRWHPDQDAVAGSALPRLMLSAIGEAMTAEGATPRVIEFTEFVQRFANDPQFRRWFAEVTRLLSAGHPHNPLCWDRLLAAGANLRGLIRYLDPNGAMVARRPVVNLDRIHALEVRALLTAEFPALLPAERTVRSPGRRRLLFVATGEPAGARRPPLAEASLGAPPSG